MDKVFEKLINNCIENDYMYYVTSLENDNQIVVVFRKEFGTLFAYQIEDGELTEIGEGRFRFYCNKKFLNLDLIRVRQDLRHHGIGKKIISCLLKFAKTVGCKKVSLISALSSVGFYQKLGFDLVSPPDDFRTIVFEKQLNLKELDLNDDQLGL